MSIGHSVVSALPVLMCAIAVFLNYPQPPLSMNLIEWKNKGTHFDFDNFNIFYIDEKGEGSSDPVVCLHGFPTSSYDWVKILPDMKKQFSRVVMLDFLGYGFSDKPESHTYTIGEQAQIVEDLLKKLNIDSAHVLSHDYGDTVALELLARHNSKELYFHMTSLTMLNGGIFPETHHPRASQKLLLTPIIGYMASRLFSLQLFTRGFGEVFGSIKPTAEDYQDFWAAMRYKDGDKAMYKIINFLRERKEFRGRWVGALQSTEVKVMMIYGPADPVNPPAFATYYREVVPKHQITVLPIEVGHYPQWESPKAVAMAFTEFIQDVQDNL